MSDERSCFNCAYGEIRCTNARGKFFDKPVLDILICGAWREKEDDKSRKRIKRMTQNGK